MAGRMRHRITAALTGAALTTAGLLITAPPASAATTATFTNGVLSVIGDSQDNTVTISRNVAGQLLVNGGAVPVAGGAPTVANTQLIQVFGLFGNDRLTLDETAGALPRANLFAGTGDDVVTGGSGADQLFGQAGADTLLGKGNNDLLFGGTEADTLTGGDADDQMFGEAGNDRLVWTNGDDTDLAEGGADTDTVEVNGGSGTESFTATANGVRVRFDRVNPAPFSVDIGTSETVQLNANAGDDRFTAIGDLAALTKLVVDGGPGADTVIGGNGADVIIGGDGADVVDGQQGNDFAVLGAGADTFQWDPGDGSDILEGQGDADRLVMNGANIGESFDLSAVGSRVRLFRNVANISMDLNDLESVLVNTAGGADTVTVNDMSGTDVTDVVADLGLLGNSAGDGQADAVRVLGTNGADTVTMTGNLAEQQVTGLTARLAVRHLDQSGDRVGILTQAGDDVVNATTLAAPARVEADGGAGDDVLIGGSGDDVLRGGADDDVLIGGAGTDALDGGPGDNILLGGEITTGGVIVTKAFLATRARTVDGGTVLDLGGRRQVTIPGLTVEALQQNATA